MGQFRNIFDPNRAISTGDRRVDFVVEDKKESSTKNKTDGEDAPPNTKSERRKRTIPAATDRRKPEAAKAETCDPIKSDDEATTFMKAMERYKRENRRPFPTWSEVLEVLRALGYRKVDAVAESTGVDRRQTEVPVAFDRRGLAAELASRGETEAKPIPPKG